MKTLYIFVTLFILVLTIPGCEITSDSDSPEPDLLKITSVSPDIASLDGGIPISIKGVGFVPGTTVIVTQRDQAKTATGSSLF